MLNMSTTINEIIYTSDGTADEILNTKSARENPYINYGIWTDCITTIATANENKVDFYLQKNVFICDISID